MTEFYAFAGEHPIFTIFLVWALCQTILNLAIIIRGGND
jgi:hypothetical protein